MLTNEPFTQGWKPCDEAAAGEEKAVCGILGPTPKLPELPAIPVRWGFRLSPSRGEPERLDVGGVLDVATSANDHIRGFSLWVCSSLVAFCVRL